MEQKPNKILKIVLAIVIVIAVSALIVSSKQAPSAAIKVGVIAPFSGDAATYGEQVKKGIDIALAEIDKGNGPKLDVIFEDNQFDPKKGLDAYNKLVKVDGVKYLISFGGNVCPVINPRAQEDKVVNFATGCNTLDFKDPFSYNFRFDVSEAAASKALIDYASSTLMTKKLALLYINNEWGTIVAKTIEDAAAADGVTIVANEKFDEQSRDIRTQIAKIKASNADSLFFLSLVNFTPSLLKQIKDSGIKTNLLTNISIEGVNASELGSVAEGVVYSAPKLDQIQSPRTLPFNKEFPDGTSRNFASWGFDSINLLFDALAAEGDVPDKVAGYLHSVKDYPGAFGKITYDEQGELQLGYQIKKVSGATFIDVK